MEETKQRKVRIKIKSVEIVPGKDFDWKFPLQKIKTNIGTFCSFGKTNSDFEDTIDFEKYVGQDVEISQIDGNKKLNRIRKIKENNEWKWIKKSEYYKNIKNK